MTNIAYSAVVLDESAQNKLKNMFGHYFQEGWEMICHHMTIKMGELQPELKSSIGLPVMLKIITFHKNDKVACVQVLPPAELSKFIMNDYPHITIAVNRKAGGKPVMSNDLLKSDMGKLNNPDSEPNTISPFTILGQIQEVAKI